MTQTKKDFIDLSQFNKDELNSLIKDCLERKNSSKDLGKGSVDSDNCGENKILATIFEKPSTRTRFSFETAMYQLGGNTIYASMSDMQLGRGETIEDTARVISRYVDIVMLRTNKHSTLEKFSENSSIPVINGLTDKSHPCQVLADLITVQEKSGSIEDKIFTWFGPANNMLNSWIDAAKILDFELRISSPKEYSVDDEVTDSFANIISISNPDEASKNSNCLITDTWFSMGDNDNNDDEKRKILSPYKVDKNKISNASSDVIFLHCLPAHRGEEVDRDVIDGNHSVVWDEAENRVHAQKGIIAWCLN